MFSISNFQKPNTKIKQIIDLYFIKLSNAISVYRITLIF
ncbi:MAG: hypothetical protein K0R94_315 [Burkholderiales bacterium]|jgi:hypothetical protein|nr:hypothetical protein [Burkholderiales bacterium]